MDKESKLTAQEALFIEGAIKRLLTKAQRIYGSQYHRISIQIVAGDAVLIGHEEIPYKGDCERMLCKVMELLDGV